MCIMLKPLFSRHKGIGVQFTDEPTGNLDEYTAKEITGIFRETAEEYEKCVVIVSHSSDVARQADVVFELRGGRLQEIEV